MPGERPAPAFPSTSYRAVAWRVVARLCQQGYSLRPYDARVLMADFARSAAGNALLQQLEHPADASPDAAAATRQQLAGQFFDFAVHSWAQLQGAKWRLIQLHHALRWGAHGLAEQHHPARVRVLQLSLAQLQAQDLTRLQAFMQHGMACEWTLAQAESAGVLQSRLRVVESLGRWLAPLCQPGSSDAVLRAAKATWCDGTHPLSVGRHLNLPAARVQHYQLVAGAALAQALLLPMRTPFRAPMPTPMPAAIARQTRPGVWMRHSHFDHLMHLLTRRTSDAGRQASEAFEYVRSHKPALRDELDADDQLEQWLDERWPGSQGQALAQAYAWILTDDAEPDPQDQADNQAWEAAARDARQRADESVALAFQALLADLPPELAQLAEALPPANLPPDYVERLSRSPAVMAAGPAAQQLALHGLAPNTFAAMARQLEVTLNRQRQPAALPARQTMALATEGLFDDDLAPADASPSPSRPRGSNLPEPPPQQPWTALSLDDIEEVRGLPQLPRVSQGPVTLQADHVAAAITAALDIPAERRLVQILTEWVADVVVERPRFIPGYCVKRKAVGRDRWVLVGRPEMRPRALAIHELHARWTQRQDPMPEQRAAAQFG